MTHIIRPNPGKSSRRASAYGQTESSADSLMALVGLVAIGLGLVLVTAAVVAAYIAFASFTPTAWATVQAAVAGRMPTVTLTDILIHGALGALAGLTVGLLHRASKVRSRLGDSFVSSLARSGWHAADRSFLVTVLVSTVVGFSVGALAAAGGATPASQWLTTGAGPTGGEPSAIGELVASGGPGGVVGGWGWWALLLLIVLVLLVQAVVLGALVGLIGYAVSGGVLGLAKGAARAVARRVAESPADRQGGFLHAVRRGMSEGAVTGTVVALLQASLTAAMIADDVRELTPPGPPPSARLETSASLPAPQPPPGKPPA